MTGTGTGPNRLSRIAAKEVPHRTDERFFSAKADVKRACEDLMHDLRGCSATPAMVTDLTTAVTRLLQQVKDVSPDEPKASSTVRDMGKEVQHLQTAQTWVSAAERVLARLGGGAASEVRVGLLEAQDSVMWCVRAQHWDGELTAATKRLEDLVKDAETLNAAYNDAAGFTEKFNLNLLTRINRELGGTFDLSTFEHHAFYNRERQRIGRAHVTSPRSQALAVVQARYEAILFVTLDAVKLDPPQRQPLFAEELGHQLMGQRPRRRDAFQFHQYRARLGRADRNAELGSSQVIFQYHHGSLELGGHRDAHHANPLHFFDHDTKYTPRPVLFRPLNALP